MQNFQDVQLALDELRKHVPPDFLASPIRPAGLVLGTGLSGLADCAAASPGAVTIPFEDLPGFPLSGVKTHAGCFIFGKVGQMPVIIQQGRCHLYEGRSPFEICMGVRIMGLMGVQALIVTNAAGALNPDFSAGTIMCMTDFINHTGHSPLRGDLPGEWGERFPDMSAPFDAGLQSLAMNCALALGLRMERGVYIGVHGPEMETPAETRMYRQWGADAVGMSTVLEVIAARHMNLRVLGLSCLTNKNLPDCMRPAPFEEIIRVARQCSVDLEKLLEAIFFEIANNDPCFASE